MDRQPASLDFAFMGHQESWDHVGAFVEAIRDPALAALSVDQIQEIYPWIPPRVTFHVQAASIAGPVVHGAYIETFIPPDRLDLQHVKENLRRVCDAAEVARQHGAGIVGLGGFTSIILEGKVADLNTTSRTSFTTGNTLTAVYVVKGVEEAARRCRLDLTQARILVIGASGDIGSACVRYFSNSCKELLLHARRLRPLQMMEKEVLSTGQACRITSDPSEFTHEADVIIAAASMSSNEFTIERCQQHTIVCDAGYPKNIKSSTTESSSRVFQGGMGHMLGGFTFNPSSESAFYRFPCDHVGHGCLLEAILLALEGVYESYSQGRGNITLDRMDNMWQMALRHGMPVAPLFNHQGKWTI